MENDPGLDSGGGTGEASGKIPWSREEGDYYEQDVMFLGAEMATPQQPGMGLALPPPTNRSRPVTRSMTRSRAEATTGDGPKTQLMSRLLGASSRTAKRTTASNLEDAEDIEYLDNQEQEEEEEGDPGPASSKSRKRKQRDSTEHRDAVQAEVSTSSSITTKPRTGLIPSQTGRPSKRQKTLTGGASKLPLRRSARLAKPLTHFHKYPMLVPELQIMVFEAALSPRLVYIQNRPDWSLKAKQPPPSWFMTNAISVAVASASYKKMFRLDVDPSMDIVALEPCCGGCRGYHCAHRHFSSVDRSTVRLLAVQMEPEWLASLPYAISPVWVTISIAWPNVETLYLMKTGLTGDVDEEKAVIRCQEGRREAELRSRFEKWKKTAGAGKCMTRLEFVVVVPKESSSTSRRERYQEVEERATGGPDDIILG